MPRPARPRSSPSARASRALQRRSRSSTGPAAPRCPDSVIDAISGYLRGSNANLGGDFATSRASDASSTTATRPPGVPERERRRGRVRPEHDDAQLRALTHGRPRTGSAATRSSCTRLDHDGNVSPWLELAHDKGSPSASAELDDECRLDLDHLRSLLSERTRVVAFPWASNAVGTVTPVAEVAALAHEVGRARVGRRGALRAARADRRRAPRAPTCCSARRTSSTGRTSGSRSGVASCSSRGGRTRCVRPTTSRCATASRPGRSRTSCWRASSPRSTTSTTSAGSSSSSTSGRSAQLPRRPAGRLDAARAADDGGARADVRDHARGVSPADAARSGRPGFAVWHGNYYAVEVMERLGLADGAVRVGIVHYNTADEVDRLLKRSALLV